MNAHTPPPRAATRALAINPDRKPIRRAGRPPRTVARAEAAKPYSVDALRARQRGPADACSIAGAEALAERIRRCWAVQGYDVEVWVENAGFHPSLRGAYATIRSNLVNGRPPAKTRIMTPAAQPPQGRPAARSEASEAERERGPDRADARKDRQA